MGRMVETLLWVWIVLGSEVCSVSLPGITDAKFINDCVSEHNRARSSVNPPASDMLYMTWDEGLAITARAWARHCRFEHNIYLDDVRRVHPTFNSVGENLWIGSPQSSFTVKGAIQSWVKEKVDYNYNRNACTNKCGHYTQVVWASSYKVGCAVQLCQNGVIGGFGNRETVNFVCNYAVGGNVIGMRPYESQGTACSRCEGTCLDSLCRSQERDSPKSYTWAPDWDPVQTYSDSNYVNILVVRPIALILTFIAAYAVHHFYPDTFCYE
ncbi:GLIPR1-like protein 1 isoform X2 [Larimichthys crocea]|uniref:GLIPR1-like protein 1 isoform X2 n=1 Tax=Larimichthys crocea TaxID=215358 RepID=UPI000F5F9A53|nr:GLIPR1-like protein 1 isoform X2 [Larimichthys crocea]